ncbi:MAG: squalene/phytoene synthase family protein [Rhodospirillales bacterium]|nr:squalene/phytoene synthase family protein [Rhodospirillales bacterium]
MNVEQSESDEGLMTLCAEHVYSFDKDRYLVTMAAPSVARHKLMTLYAFNVEVAQICDNVSESILGDIRFQWWRDQIASAYAQGPRSSGIAGALYDTIQTSNIRQSLFERLLDSRQRDLDKSPPQTREELITYCEGTSSTLVQLSMELLDPKYSMSQSAGEGGSELAHHTGIAWALCGLIRAMPHHTAHGRCYIPAQMLADAGVGWEYLHHDTDAVIPLMETLATTAEQHLASARQLARDLPTSAVASILVIPLASHYLSVLRKAGFNPYDARVQQTHSISKTLRLMWATMWKRV